MELRKGWLSFMLTVLWMINICRPQNAAIQHLTKRVGRLSRITNGLLSDVDEIWTALSNTGANSGNLKEVCNETELKLTDSKYILKLVNETVSDAKELKTEVEEFILYAEKGLRNEKAHSREAIKDVKMHQRDFKENITDKISEMKNWLQSFAETQQTMQTEKMNILRSTTEESNEMLQHKIQNITNDYEERLKETNVKVQECNDKLETVQQSVSSLEQQVLNEVEVIKKGINEKLLHAATCTSGWVSSGMNCYLFSSNAMTWDEASDFCKSKESYLVETNDHGLISTLVQICKSNSIWVGANDKETEGTFIWYNSKSAVSQDYFYPGEPNNSRGSEDCVELYCKTSRIHKLNDSSCANKKHFVCEKSKSLV